MLRVLQLIPRRLLRIDNRRWMEVSVLQQSIYRVTTCWWEDAMSSQQDTHPTGTYIPRCIARPQRQSASTRQQLTKT